MKHIIWHKIVYAFLWLGFTAYYKLFHNYHFRIYRPKSKTYLVLSNHNSDGDQFMVGIPLVRHMYYVASEHLFRQGLASKLIKSLAAPIVRKKGNEGKSTIKDITYALSHGANVCLFVEGNRSFNGETGWISSSNGALVKNSGAGLITFRLDGGYLRTPRWAAYRRKGPEYGQVIHEYTKEDLASMTEDEITEAIKRDVYTNAYTFQKEHPEKYSGRNLAEHLETLLFVCPKCHGIDTMTSIGDRFFCSCGLDVKINEYCFFESNKKDPVPFETVYDWDKWQRSYLTENIESIIKEYTDKPFFSHEGQRLSRINIMKDTDLLCEGKMELFSDRLLITGTDCKNVFTLNDIAAISVTKMMTLFFSTKDGGYYEIKSESIRTGVGYVMMYRYLTGKDYI